VVYDDDRKWDDVAEDHDGDDDRAVRQQVSDDDEYREHDASKRKWGKYSLQAWGKRRWSEANGKATWEKRDEENLHGDELGRNLGQRDPAAWNKRRWSANNGMRAWGKRSRRPYVDGRSKRSVRGRDDDPEILVGYHPRRWAPVKRQWRRTAGRYDGPKRKWEFNTMKSWGKRDADWPDDVDDGRSWPKRSWSSDNSLRIWG